MNYQEKYPHLKHGATNGQIYNPFIELAKTGTKEEQQSYLSAVVLFTQTLTKDSIDCAADQVLANIGYWAGYFDKGDIELVNKVYGANHPVFLGATPNLTNHSF